MGRLETRKSVIFQDVMGYRIVGCAASRLVREVEQTILRGERGWLACLNPHSWVKASQKNSAHLALKEADWLIPDGVGVCMAARVLGVGRPARITGSDVFWLLNDRLNANGGARVFLLGSTERTLKEMQRRMQVEWPRIRVVGTLAPPFRDYFEDADVRAMTSAVNKADPDVLWVGMTAPKQEEWLRVAFPYLNANFAGAIGAVFDFFAGNVTRPHWLVRNIGLEWLARLVRDPLRLWDRTMISAPKFVFALCVEKLRTVFGLRRNSREAQAYGQSVRSHESSRTLVGDSRSVRSDRVQVRLLGFIGVVTGFVLCASLIPNGLKLLPWYEPGVAQILTYGVLSAISVAALRDRSVVGVCSFWIIVGLVVEVSQLFIPMRDGHVEDLGFIYLGVLIGGVVGEGLWQLYRKLKEAPGVSVLFGEQ